ncbi:hypothetical protein GQR58_014609 [Nymphon striatum]|nr:hypothetical protein GQR58_014609 [Nymphon striatum]
MWSLRLHVDGVCAAKRKCQKTARCSAQQVAAILDSDDEETLGFYEDYPSDELETDSDDNVDNDNDSESDSDNENPVDRLPIKRMPAPPPPPPPPPGPPPPPTFAQANKPPTFGKNEPLDRNALLSSIRQGTKLKKAETLDKSAPVIPGKVTSNAKSGGTSGSSNPLPNGGGPVMLGALFADGIPKLRSTGQRPGADLSDSCDCHERPVRLPKKEDCWSTDGWGINHEICKCSMFLEVLSLWLCQHARIGKIRLARIMIVVDAMGYFGTKNPDGAVTHAILQACAGIPVFDFANVDLVIRTNMAEFDALLKKRHKSGGNTKTVDQKYKDEYNKESPLLMQSIKSVSHAL